MFVAWLQVEFVRVDVRKYAIIYTRKYAQMSWFGQEKVKTRIH